MTGFLVFLAFAAGPLTCSAIQYYIESQREEQDYTDVWIWIIPPMWVFWPFCLGSLYDDWYAMRVDKLKRAHHGLPPVDGKSIRKLKRAWDKRYTYLGEVNMLAPDYLHPYPEVPEPSQPDPRRPGEEHACRSFYCNVTDRTVYRSHTCTDWKHRYPEPSLGRVFKLIAEAPHKNTAKLQRAQQLADIQATEYELLGMKDTDDLINHISQTLDKGVHPTQTEVQSS